MSIDVSDRRTARFWTRVDKGDESGCWEWTGSTTHNGYGTFRASKADLYRAHRYAWTAANQRQIPEGLMVLHECDNRACVRPSHLKLGTAADNTADMLNRARHPGPPHPNGERQHLSKLTESDVRQIRDLASSTTQRALGARFGVAKATIAAVIHRATWHHVS